MPLNLIQTNTSKKYTTDDAQTIYTGSWYIANIGNTYWIPEYDYPTDEVFGGIRISRNGDVQALVPLTHEEMLDAIQDWLY